MLNFTKAQKPSGMSSGASGAGGRPTPAASGGGEGGGLRQLQHQTSSAMLRNLLCRDLGLLTDLISAQGEDEMAKVLSKQVRHKSDT